LSDTKDPRFTEIEQRPNSRERVIAFGELSSEASAEGDLHLAVLAKCREVRDARGLGLQEHAVVAGAELLGLIPRLRERGPIKGEGSYELGRDIVWSLKYATGAALDIPEIPFSAVDDLLRVLGEMLDELERQPYALWQLEARRWFIEGEDDKVKERVERLLPHVNRTNHFYHHLDCPGCSLIGFAKYLGPGASPEAVLEVLRPLIEKGGRYDNEPEQFRMVMDLFFGERESCEVALFSSRALYAQVLARNGRAFEGARFSREALSLYGKSKLEHTVLPYIAALEVARRLRDDKAALAGAYDRLVEIIPKVEDAYERHEALLSAHAAARALGRDQGEIDALSEQTLACARRLDARLSRPRHVRETEAALVEA